MTSSPIRDLLDPDVEYRNPPDALEPGTRRGRDEFIRVLEVLLDAFAYAEMEPERVIEVGDRMGIAVRIRAEGKASGARIDQRFGHLLTIEDGRLVSLEWFNDPDRALDAASSDRVRISRAGLADYNRGDFDSGLARFDPEIEWDTTRLLPDGRVYRGREEIRAYWEEVAERWDELRVEDHRWLGSDDHVVMLGRFVGKGTESGVPVEAPWHQVWTFRGEAPVRCDNHSDADAALRAAEPPNEEAR